MMTPDNEETGIPAWGFALGAAVVVIGAFATIWFMFPGPDNRYDVVSPSGAARIELGELCTETTCNRVAILDRSGARSGCSLSLEGNRPLFDAITTRWSADETAVELTYIAQTGETGTVSITLADCTLTQ